VPWTLRDDFPVPFDLTLSFERSVAGSHRALVTNVVALDMVVYFQVF